jgi:hypothetical protein
MGSVNYNLETLRLLKHSISAAESDIKIMPEEFHDYMKRHIRKEKKLYQDLCA